MNKQKLSIASYTIAKNEERSISRMIDSLLDLDEIIIVDTGSTDATYDLIKSKNQIKHTRISIQPWRFDIAKNVALSLVSPNIDYVISIDADEMIDAKASIDNLRSFISNEFQKTNQWPLAINHNFATVWNWQNINEVKNISKHYHTRVHKRNAAHWILPVHEKLKFSNDIINFPYCDSFSLLQYPFLDKHRDYKNSLKLSILEDPYDWKLKIFLSDELIHDNHNESLKFLLDAYECIDADKVFILIKLHFFYIMGKDYSKAIENIMKAISLCNNIRELWVYAAECFRILNETINENHAWETARACIIETNGYMRAERCWNNSMKELT